MSEFREFGISAETAFLLKKDFSFQNCKDFVAQYGRYLDPEPIHVIEYSALEQAEAKIKELESKLSIAVEALQRYANGQALKVKPEKIHLYIDDICHGNPLWHQRSMSDYDDRLLAKEALEKLRG